MGRRKNRQEEKMVLLCVVISVGSLLLPLTMLAVHVFTAVN